MDKSTVEYKMEELTDISDANNNNDSVLLQTDVNIKSYSLRPRSSVRPGQDIDDDVIMNDWRPRGRTKRRPKQKPPPLSKYRRKTANARERSRMREINEAFDTLRRAIPHLTQENSHSEKLTKITTLRLAMKYIAALTQALQDPEPESDLDSAEYTLSLTPTSLSDHSDLYDQFLISDPSSSTTSSTTSCTFRSTSDVHLPSSYLPTSPCYSLTPTDASASLLDIRDHCLTPSDFSAELDSFVTASDSFVTASDSFVTSSVDFEELFAS